jgi:hypothetical protein
MTWRILQRTVNPLLTVLLARSEPEAGARVCTLLELLVPALVRFGIIGYAFRRSHAQHERFISIHYNAIN